MSQETDRAEEKPAHLDRLSPLWRRLNDHKIVQWSVAYVAVAYAIQHAIILTSESFEWPNAVARISMLLLALGLPLVVTFAWYHGAQASRNFSQAELSILTALLAIGSLFFYVMVRPSENAAAPVAQQASVAAARAASLNPGSAISLAVLPFVNLSSDKEQEFFSDGMTEEITAALAKVPDLRVVARTSAFEFKGKNVNIKTMGEELGATHLIEGSVRKAGNRLRITAQLIKADDGTHIWAEDYDRELTDVFAIQEDIARAITSSLHMTLGLKPGETLINGTQNVGIYQDYLQAKAWFRDRNSTHSGPFLQTLESVVARDPGFAPAWAELGRAYGYQIVISPAVPEGPMDKARNVLRTFGAKIEMAAQKAIQLDPRHPGGYATLAVIRGQAGQFASAEDLYRQALALDPNDPEALAGYGATLLRVGKVKAASDVYGKLRALEPLLPAYAIVQAQAMLVNGKNKAAIDTLKALPEAQYVFREIYLSRAYAADGRFADASDELHRAAALFETRGVGLGKPLEDAARVLRAAPTKVADAKTLPTFGRPGGELSFVYLYVGAPDRFLDYHEREVQLPYLSDFGKQVWIPDAAPIRKSERFASFVRNAGLVDYWKARGWPDLCHPVGTDDFACE